MQNQAAEQIVKVIKEANNVLVTVKNNPSVDELTAAIGLTLILNHMNKHAVTVFSGRVPSTIEFLQPEMAIDTNTDSLRDFIIALDKSKADKLRYKVEDNVVRIFITPYKTSISERDLEFSQGDFNVDAVVALGVVQKEDFDQAVTAHGRILHDATVVALTNHDKVSNIGAINWQEQQASSISEMIASITDQLGDELVDGQIATALMTGIVAETDRFRNEKTTPQVLAISSKLMSMGANQQLIAEKLEEPDVPHPVSSLQYGNEDVSEEGALEITHDENVVHNIDIDENGNLQIPSEPAVEENQQQDTPPINEPVSDEGRTYAPSAVPPTLFAQDDSGTVNAQPLLADQQGSPEGTTASNITNGVEEQPEAVMSEEDKAMLQHGKKVIQPLSGNQEVAPDESSTQTLSDLEVQVGSDHVDAVEPQSIDDFLGNASGINNKPSEDVNKAITEARQESEQAKASQEENKPIPEPVKEEKVEPPQVDPLQQPPPQVVNPTAAPTVPPPLMPPTAQPQFFDADGNVSNPFTASK